MLRLNKPERIACLEKSAKITESAADLADLEMRFTTDVGGLYTISLSDLEIDGEGVAYLDNLYSRSESLQR